MKAQLKKAKATGERETKRGKEAEATAEVGACIRLVGVCMGEGGGGDGGGGWVGG